eukprot:scaffold80_cov325-Pavlova_lutheri.AAC.47
MKRRSLLPQRQDGGCEKHALVVRMCGIDRWSWPVAGTFYTSSSSRWWDRSGVHTRRSGTRPTSPALACTGQVPSKRTADGWAKLPLLCCALGLTQRKGAPIDRGRV